NGCFVHEIFFVLYCRAAELKDRALVLLMRDRLLSNLSRIAVLHGDVARWANEIGLLDALLQHVFIVISVAKEREEQLERVGTLGQDMASGECVKDLLNHQTGEDGVNRVRELNLEFLARLEQRGIGERVSLLIGA